MRPPTAQQLRDAARRFSAQVPGSFGMETAAAATAPAAAPTLDPRRRRMAETLSRTRARSMVLEAESRGAPADSGQTLAQLAEERIIGQSDIVGIDYLELAIAVSRAVCRIRVGGAAGTGFLVGPRILMTNHHVLASSAEAGQAEAQFDYQENRSGELLPVRAFRFDPGVFFLTDPRLDFTLVATAETSARGVPVSAYPWVKLLGQPGKADEGSPLNIIQHPLGGLKQIALRHNDVIRIPDGKTDFLYYTTDTEPGSSGSPCFNDQWELVALHHSGVPRTVGGQVLRRDGQPWREGIDDPALVDWIANEGARISAIVAALRSEVLSGAAADLLARMLEDEPPNPIELARQDAGGPPSAAPHVGPTGTSFDVPLRISISIGEAAATVVALAPGGTALAAAGAPGAASAVRAPSDDIAATEAVVIDPDWSDRKGYDPEFLGTTVPLPKLSAAMKKTTVQVKPEFRRADDPYRLDYHHYSLAMNSDRCFAWFSAANVDGDHRFSFQRGKDKWFLDPRIDTDFQCGEELYSTADTDRGHLTRYLDVAWGADEDEAKSATYDSFHFTNCCLQLSGFNQGKSRWQGIEQYLLEKKARKEKRRIVVITGPLFRDTDPYYQNDQMDYSIPVPLEFWKVCAIVRADGTLAATAFVLGQKDILALPGFEEAFDVAAAQVTVADLEQRTGLDFGLLADHDHFAEGGAAGTLELSVAGGGKRKLIPIRDFEDIVV
jgi:endonuclease G